MQGDCSLSGKTILVTRALEQAEPFVNKIKKLGGTPIVVPLLGFREPIDTVSIIKTIECLDTYNWIIFTSVNGVQFFFEQLKKRGLELNKVMKFAVVGKKTEAALLQYCYSPIVMPSEYVAEAFAEELIQHINPDESVLFPRGNLAREVIVKQLQEQGINIQDLIVYETVEVPQAIDTLHKLLKEKQLDYITFTSSSTVEHFVKALKEDLYELIENIKLVGIGPITEKTALKYNMKLDIVSDVYTTDGMLDAICDSLKES